MMKNTLLVFCLLIGVVHIQADIFSAKKLDIIPMPAYVEMQDGDFSFSENIKIYADDSLEFEADYLAQMVTEILSVNHQYCNNISDGHIQLILNNSIKNKEGYSLEVDAKKITISARTPQGVFYGLQSLKQLLILNAKVGITCILPGVIIKDEPLFKYRGMHLDVGRHFFSVEFIKKYIDILALHKINSFHWHLTEDQGWRIEIKKYPKLTEIGAWRKETLVGHMDDKPLTFDGKQYGGFYTQNEVKQIVTYASKRHITIIPEIDMPGHSRAAIAAYPHLGTDGEKYEVATKWGVFPQIYSPTDETITFLENVLSEVMELFPGKYIHIGGDEALKTQWENSDQVQQLIKDQGLKDEHELQAWFIEKIGRFIAMNGKSLIGWDEILDGGAPKGATIMFWRSWLGTNNLEKAITNGHEVIMTPASHCYFDHYQVSERKHKDEPLANMGNTSVKKVYNMSVVPEGLPHELHQKVLGAQGNVWTEYITTTDYLEYMVVPRITALSEVLWTIKEERNWVDFNNRLQQMSLVFKALDINYSTHFIK